MKESVLRAAAIASIALALIMSVTTWVGISSSSHRGSFWIGFFEFLLILFLGVVAWALFNALADAGTARSTLDVLDARMRRIEKALGVGAPDALTQSGADMPRESQQDGGDATRAQTGSGTLPEERAGSAAEGTTNQGDASSAGADDPKG